MSIHQSCHNCSRCSEEVYLFETIRYSRWLPMPLIGWNNFNVSRTTACEVARFVRNVLLGVFKKFFRQNDSKSHRASLSCDWQTFFSKAKSPDLPKMFLYGFWRSVFWKDSNSKTAMPRHVLPLFQTKLHAKPPDFSEILISLSDGRFFSKNFSWTN